MDDAFGVMSESTEVLSQYVEMTRSTCASDPGFATLISTYAMERRMHDARLGWRIEGDRMIGWTHGRETYEDLLPLAETLAAIVDDFPERAWCRMG